MISKSREPLPPLLVGNMKDKSPAVVKSIWNQWCFDMSIAMATWVDGVRDVEYWNQELSAAHAMFKEWQSKPSTEKYLMETRYDFGGDLPVPAPVDILEGTLRAALRKTGQEQGQKGILPKVVLDKAKLYGYYSTRDLLFLTMREIGRASCRERV